MDALSSTINIRRWASDAGSATGGLRAVVGQLEYERGSAARSLAGHPQRAAEFLRRKSAAVQAEPMSVRAGGKAVSEEARHVLRGNAHSIVDDADAHAGRSLLDAQGNQFVGPARFIAGVLGVAHQIHPDLEHLVLVHGDRRHFAE